MNLFMGETIYLSGGADKVCAGYETLVGVSRPYVSGGLFMRFMGYVCAVRGTPFSAMIS